MNFIELGGVSNVMLKLPVRADAREALTEAGVKDIPAFIALHVRQASMRERTKFEATQEKLAADPAAWAADLIARRAEEGTDPRVIAEVAADLGPTEIAQLMYAFTQGEVITDPKALEGVALMVKNQMTMSSQALMNVVGQVGLLPS